RPNRRAHLASPPIDRTPGRARRELFLGHRRRGVGGGWPPARDRVARHRETSARSGCAARGTPVLERIYKAEGTNSDSWRWRVDEPNGVAFSSAHLAAAWVAGLSIVATE